MTYTDELSDTFNEALSFLPAEFKYIDMHSVFFYFDSSKNDYFKILYSSAPIKRFSFEAAVDYPWIFTLLFIFSIAAISGVIEYFDSLFVYIPALALSGFLGGLFTHMIFKPKTLGYYMKISKNYRDEVLHNIKNKDKYHHMIRLYLFRIDSEKDALFTFYHEIYHLYERHSDLEHNEDFADAFAAFMLERRDSALSKKTA